MAPERRPPTPGPAPEREEERPPSASERRDEKKRRQRARMAKHGAGLRRVYRDAVLKRMKDKEKSGGS